MSDLLTINVNGHTEKKNGLTYLSWAWAWAEVLKIDPEAEWEAVEYSQPDGSLVPCMYVGEGTAMVKTRVTINGKTKVCMLPVMDHRNKAIKNPDAFAINTAIMRCMTKAISMHGLGLYIYAGEDLPESGSDASVSALLEQSIEQAKQAKSGKFEKVCKESFDALQVEIQDHLRRVAPQVDACKDAHQAIDIMEIAMDEWPDEDRAELKKGLWYLLDSKTRSAISAVQKSPKKETA